MRLKSNTVLTASRTHPRDLGSRQKALLNKLQHLGSATVADLVAGNRYNHWKIKDLIKSGAMRVEKTEKPFVVHQQPIGKAAPLHLSRVLAETLVAKNASVAISQAVAHGLFSKAQILLPMSHEEAWRAVQNGVLSGLRNRHTH